MSLFLLFKPIPLQVTADISAMAFIFGNFGIATCFAGGWACSVPPTVPFPVPVPVVVPVTASAPAPAPAPALDPDLDFDRTPTTPTPAPFPATAPTCTHTPGPAPVPVSAPDHDPTSAIDSPPAPAPAPAPIPAPHSALTLALLQVFAHPLWSPLLHDDVPGGGSLQDQPGPDDGGLQCLRCPPVPHHPRS